MVAKTLVSLGCSVSDFVLLDLGCSFFWSVVDFRRCIFVWIEFVDLLGYIFKKKKIETSFECKLTYEGVCSA